MKPARASRTLYSEPLPHNGLLPDLELDRLVLDVVEALDLASHGREEEGYWCLKLGEERAQVMTDEGYGWGPLLLLRYEYALSEYRHYYPRRRAIH